MEIALATTHFSAITPENSMKPMFVQPTEGRFDFADGDRIVELAQKSGATSIGHCAAARCLCLIGKIVLVAVLANWVAAAPLIWILRDGLGPGMIESAGMKAVCKFLVGWGVPALIITGALAGLLWIEQRSQAAQAQPQEDE